ncbi:MAG: glycoside hydrolase family 31 protein [Chloroflexus sp.]
MKQAPARVGLTDTRYFTPLTRLGTVQLIERGVLAALDHEWLRVEFIRDDIVRLKVSRGGVFDEHPTYAVCVDLAGAPIPSFSVSETDTAITLRSARLEVIIGRNPFTLTARRADGSLVFATAAGHDGLPWAYATLNDAFAFHRVCKRDDAFLGLGEKTGRLNRKGRDFILWNNDVLSPQGEAEFAAGRDPADPRTKNTSTEFDPYYISIPFFYHLDENGNAAGFFLDNSYRLHVDFSPAETYGVCALGGQYTEYVFAGPQMAAILAGFTWLTGRLTPPPIWALGYHQCRWHRYHQADILALARRHRERGIPCDTLWLDIEHMDGYRVFTWNRELFPDPVQLAAQLREQGFRLITIVDPGVKVDPQFTLYEEGRTQGFFCRTASGEIYVGQVWPGRTAFPDFAKPEVRAWWGKLNADHARLGVAGIWNDMNEPATGDIPPYAMRFLDGREPHERYHNQYALLMAMATVDGLRTALPNLRTFVLSRAGFAGIQRYAANWMGDNCARWDHLWMSMPMAMGTGLSGQAFIGADIGGFAGDTQPELFARWMQYAALTPFCRNHSAYGHIDQYVWSFGPAIERIARDAIRLRYRLMPYLVTAMMHTVETGEPLQQPLVFAYQADRLTRDIDDQFLLGRDLLVAPVYEPGATMRQLYLPAGEWYDWYSDTWYDGEQFIAVAAMLDRIPLFARAGAVIPLWPEAPATTMDYQPQVIELHLFVPRRDGIATADLHEDDGLTFDFQHGAYYRTTFQVERRGQQVTLSAVVRGDGFATFVRESFTLVFHGPTPEVVVIDGVAQAVVAGRFTFANHGQGFTITFAVE